MFDSREEDPLPNSLPQGEGTRGRYPSLWEGLGEG